jgi:drug/metabolite transporter (DMT)-like permease
VSPSDSRRSELNGAIAAAVGSTSVGFVPFFIIGLQQAGVGTVSSLSWRYAVALAVLIPLALWRHRLVEEWRRGGKWLTLNALTLGVFQVYCYFSAIERLPTSVVVTIFYFYPVLALVLDRLLFGIPFGPATLASVLVIVFGVGLTSLPGLLGATLDPVGVGLVLMSALGYSFYIAAAYPVTKAVAPLASAVFIYGAYGLVFGTIAMVMGFHAPPSPELWANVLFIGTLGGALQILSFAYALPRLSSSGYAVIVCLEFVTVVLAGVVLLGERLVGVQWVGIGLVLAGIVLVRLMRAAELARRTAAVTVASKRA